MTKHCVPTPRSKVASTPAEAESAAEALGESVNIRSLLSVSHFYNLQLVDRYAM